MSPPRRAVFRFVSEAFDIKKKMQKKALMHHRLVETEVDLLELRDAWDHLLAAGEQPSLPLSWEWFQAWWRGFRQDGAQGRRRRLHIHVSERDGVVVAIVPMIRLVYRFRGMPARAVATMANGYTPFWDAVLHPGLSVAELDEIARAVFSAAGVDVWVLRRVAGDSWLLGWLQAQEDWRERLVLRETMRTPVLYTSGSWAGHLATRSRKYRKNLAKKLREFSARPGAHVQCVPLVSGHDALMAELTEVSRHSWKRLIGNDLHSSPAGRDFLGCLADMLGPRGDAQVWIARLDGKAVAFELHFRAAGITYPIRADIDQRYRDLAPGSVVEFYAIEAAFHDPEINVYDTCAADYWYLRNLTDDVREVHEAMLFAQGWWPGVLHGIEKNVLPMARRLRGLRGSHQARV